MNRFEIWRIGMGIIFCCAIPFAFWVTYDIHKMMKKYRNMRGLGFMGAP